MQEDEETESDDDNDDDDNDAEDEEDDEEDEEEDDEDEEEPEDEGRTAAGGESAREHVFPILISELVKESILDQLQGTCARTLLLSSLLSPLISLPPTLITAPFFHLLFDYSLCWAAAFSISCTHLPPVQPSTSSSSSLPPLSSPVSFLPFLSFRRISAALVQKGQPAYHSCPRRV